MTDLLPFIVTGLVTGAIYGLAGVGLVLTYKTSGVFNFAHGAIATVSAYGFFELHVQREVPWPVAAVVCVLVVGPVLGLLFELVARVVASVTLELKVAATVGVLVAVQAAVVLIYGQGETRTVPVFLPTGSFDLLDATVQVADAITFAFAVAVTVALSVWFRRARAGLAMRATVSDPTLLDLSGTSPLATRRRAWIVGTGLASASGVLFAPVLPLDPTLLTLLVVQAFGAAAIGRFTSLSWTFTGGLIIGVLAALCTKWFTDGLLAGLPSGLPFVVLFATLLIFPKRWLTARDVAERHRATWVAPDRLQALGGVVLLAVLLLVPEFAGIRLTDWTVAVATVVVFLSLGLLVRTSGQVSLGHIGFTAIGAAAFSHLAVGEGIPWFLALLGAGLVAVPIGALLAIPAIRLGGLYLALATFGFGVLLQFMFYTQDFMFGDTGAGLDEPRPELFSDDRAFYYLVLGIAVLVVALVVGLNRSRLGRLLRGMADSPTALATNGTSVEVTRVLVFCISAFLAAVGGALAAVAQTTVSADSYAPLLSLTYFAVVVIAIGREPWYAVMAAGFIVLVPSYVAGEDVDAWLQVLFGLAAVATAIVAGRATPPLAVRDAIDRVFGGRRRTAATAAAATSGAVPATVEALELRVEGLEVRFGGIHAVQGLDLVARTGKVTGLIGPNGAGKTTTFNACSGLQAPTGGRVLLDGRDVTRRGPAARARLGLGRTFQRMQLFESLSVRENVAIGCEGTIAGANPVRHALGTRAQRRRVRAATDEALALCGLEELAETTVSGLSTGQRRLVELARCLAGPFRVLLLDEPSSGLDPVETEHFATILTSVVQARGVGVLLVEHDMSFVLGACDDVYVLDFGRPIFHGTPAEVERSAVVQAAYLGDPAVEDDVLHLDEVRPEVVR